MLLHVMGDGCDNPIALPSCMDVESEYSQVEKETLSFIFGVKGFHTYFYGRKFTLVTDHKPLTTILGPKEGVPPLAAARLQHWALCLSLHSFDSPTAEHSNADRVRDCLSNTMERNWILHHPYSICSSSTVHQ